MVSTVDKNRSLVKLCRHLVATTAGVRACGVVELATGAILGVAESSGVEAQQVRRILAMSLEAFEGVFVAKIGAMVRTAHALPGHGDSANREVFIKSGGMQMFARSIADGVAALALVTQPSVTVGMGWAQTRAAARQVEAVIES